MEVDILGPKYRRQTLHLPADREGEVTATLIRRSVAAEGISATTASTMQSSATETAVLYLHGFADYFFQEHLADFYIERGIDFYAIDLRKYGRSLGRHQTANHCEDLQEYYPELDRAIEIIRNVDGHRRVLLNAHSLGGLLATLWIHDRTRPRSEGTSTPTRPSPPVDALFLNSPFLEFNAPPAIRIPMTALLSALGRRWPGLRIPFRMSALYSRTIHSTHGGAWTYDLRWKPPQAFPIHAGWVRAVRTAQRRARAGLNIDIPILVGTSQHSAPTRRWTASTHSADTVLNVTDMVTWAPQLGSDVTLLRIAGGLHDLTLSDRDARSTLFAELGRWLDHALPPATPENPPAD